MRDNAHVWGNLAYVGASVCKRERARVKEFTLIFCEELEIAVAIELLEVSHTINQFAYL